MAAGGASFVTFPALIFAGLSPLAANTTNFVGLLLSQPIGLATSYRSEISALGWSLLPSLAVAAAGGAAGAILLLHTGESGFARVVPWLMLLATVLFATGPLIRAAMIARMRVPLTGSSLACLALIFLFSVYTGYFGAGVGMMLLGVLVAFGYDDVHAANAVKNATIAVASLVATAIYGLSGPVVWPAALALMAGVVVGSYAGGVLAKRAPQDLLRTSLIILASLFTLYLFWR